MSVSPQARPVSVRQTVLACLLAGAAIVFILLGRAPGWEIYLTVVFLAVAFLAGALFRWSISDWIGLAALAVLLMGMIYQRDRPASVFTALALIALSAYRLYGQTAARSPGGRRRRFRRGNRRF
jgi:cell division protein FtsW (lipid II flippase)